MKLAKRLLGFFPGAIVGMNLCLFPFSTPASGMIRAVPLAPSSAFLLIQAYNTDLDLYTGPPPPHFTNPIPFHYPRTGLTRKYKLWEEEGPNSNVTFTTELPSPFHRLDDTTVVDCTKRAHHVLCEPIPRGRGREGDRCKMVTDERMYECAPGFKCVHRADPPDTMACIRCDMQTQAGRQACR
jgi:hypothetical protein